MAAVHPIAIDEDVYDDQCLLFFTLTTNFLVEIFDY